MTYRDTALVPVEPECNVGALCEAHRRLARQFNLLLKDFWLLKAAGRKNKNYAIISLNDGSTAQTGLDTTPVKLTGFDTVGISSGDIDASATDDRVTSQEDGIYNINFQISFSGSTSTIFNFEVYKNGAATGYALRRDMGTGGAVGSGSVFALLQLDEGDYIEIYVFTESGSSKSVTPVTLQLKVNYQSEAP